MGLLEMEPCKVRLTVDTLPAVAVRARRELCADVSGAAHEDLAATASRIDRWVLVEYRGLWDRDVLGGSLLSQPLKEHLRDQLRKLGHSRLLFVKRPERRSHKRRMLYVGSCRPGEERFYGLEFDHHDDLVGYDFASALLDGSTPGVPVEHPLFVVCTHGKRDRCCAKYGRPLYDRLKAQGRPRMGLAVDARGRRPLRRQRRRPPEGAFLRPSRRGGPRPDPRRLLRRAPPPRALPRPLRLHVRRAGGRARRARGDGPHGDARRRDRSASRARPKTAGSSRYAPPDANTPPRPGPSSARTRSI